MDELEKFSRIVSFAELAVERAQRRSDQVVVGISIVSAGLIGIVFATLAASKDVQLWARLLLAGMALIALAACGCTLLLRDPAVRKGPNDPRAFDQFGRTHGVDAALLVEVHANIALQEYIDYRTRIANQANRALAALFLATASLVVALVIVLV